MNPALRPFEDAGTGWQRLRNFSRTLRFRLTLWNTGIVLIAVVTALFSVREGLRYSLEHELEVVLAEEANELQLAIYASSPDRQQIIAEMQRKAASHRSRGWYVRWLEADHESVIYDSDPLIRESRAQVARAQGPQTVWVSPGFRTVENEVSAEGRVNTFVRVSARTEFIDMEIARITRVLAPVGLAILILAPIGGLLVAERAIDPLQKIIATTQRLRPHHLKERLNVRGVGDELDQLARQINHFLDQIADHLQLNNEFIANAAHDLRSPLAAMLASIDVTLGKPRAPEEYEELLFSLQSECLDLKHLVNQLLQLAESDAGTVVAMPAIVELDKLLRGAVDMFSAVAEEKGAVLEATRLDPTLILGDRGQLKQLVTNLVDNAIKFTTAGGTIRVELRNMPLHGTMQLTIADTGNGISEADLPRIFDRFFQVDRVRNRDERRGSGLGLSICLAIVSQHKGTIRAESKLGVGTTMTVTLPSQSPSLAGALSAPAVGGG